MALSFAAAVATSISSFRENYMPQSGTELGFRGKQLPANTCPHA